MANGKIERIKVTVRILLADDHKMMRQALSALLSNDIDIQVVGEAGDGREVLEKLGDTKPDIVVMDVNMPNLNGMETTKQITDKQPGIKVIGLSAYPDKRFVMGMLEAGAAAYIVKAEAGDELFRAIHAVMNGQTYLCPIISASLYEPVRGVRKDGRLGLSSREREVLILLAQGLHSPKIGESLGISPATVEVHRRNIMRKLGVRGVAELTKYAIREGMVEP